MTERDKAVSVRHHRWMLLWSAVIVLLAFVLRVRNEERVYFVGLPDYPLPPSCVSYMCFGVRCPGCGLTRSFVYLAQGDWESSWQQHRLGWLLAALLLAQFPYRVWALAGPRLAPLGVAVPRLIGYFILALLLVNWLLGIAMQART